MKSLLVGKQVLVLYAGEWCLGRIVVKANGGHVLVDMQKYGAKWLEKPKARRQGRVRNSSGKISAGGG
jgi:hypothetical protein